MILITKNHLTMTTANTKRRGTRNTINVEDFKNWINKQLERTDPYADDKFKAALCSVLEYALKMANRYKGYNDNYWLKAGFDEWRNAGEPDFPEKEKYIYGPTGQRYNRHYY
jgi:hypothetical protein